MIEAGVKAELVSTFASDPWPGLRSYWGLPVALSGLRSSGAGTRATRSRGTGLRTGLRQWIGPLTIPIAARRLQKHVEAREPDLVHALRVPFEGMTAAWARLEPPLVISTWGNDFTLHARANPLMRFATGRAMQVVAGLISDCRRDLELAKKYGFKEELPSIVLPGNGGLAPEFFNGPSKASARPKDLGDFLAALEADEALVVNPRGFRAYVRSDTFFKAIPGVLARRPRTHFVCPAMAGEPVAEEWIRNLSLESNVTLLEKLEPRDMAILLRRSEVMVSLSEHDGTPNTLLEAMACGAVPVAGRLASVAEWIDSGVNGHLVDPGDVQATTEAIIRVLDEEEWRRRAVEYNREQVGNTATRPVVQTKALRFYEDVS